MANKKEKKSVIWTVCYILWEDGQEDDPWTATWFAYGRDAAEAKERFLEDFHRHPEDFWDSTEDTHIVVDHVYRGFSC